MNMPKYSSAPEAGYSLLELLIATSILLVISSLSMVVIQSSTESNVMGAAKEQVNADLRGTMLAVTSEVRQAYSQRTVESEPPMAPEDAFSVSVLSSGSELRFNVPRPSTTSAVPEPSPPITIRFENEDTNGNGLLDSGEDGNGDGVLTRRLIRIEGAETRVLGAANNISDVLFALEASPATSVDTMNVLSVQLVGERAYGPGEEKKAVHSELVSKIHLEN